MRLQRPPTAAVRKIRLLCVHTPAARGVKRLLQPALDAHATMVLPSSDGEDKFEEVDDAEAAGTDWLCIRLSWKSTYSEAVAKV